MLIEKLKAIVGNEWVITDEERIIDYLSDETGMGVMPKPVKDQILVKPGTTRQVSDILKIANDSGIPVFPRGGGTGLCGGAVPTERGIIISMERMKGLTIDRHNLMAIVEAGVTLRELIDGVEKEGYFFPPHPGDESAQIGGLVACNAGGARALKYGVMRSYIKGIEAVLPTGEILELGGKLLKNNTGYNLMHLLIGSEGTLAVITRVVLRLFAPLAASATMIVPYENRHDAIHSVPAILKDGILPLAIEYMDRGVVINSAEHLGIEWPCSTGAAYLMIIVDGTTDEEVHSLCHRISVICRRFYGLEPLIGKTKKEQERILRIRSNIYSSLKHDLVDSLDIVVPPSNMGELMDAIDAIAIQYNTTIPMCGHAGDGNLHPIMMNDLLAQGRERLREVKRTIYKITRDLGGTMTAEHGLGKIRLKDLDIFMDKKSIELNKGIKQVFDPKGILNPGCIVIDSTL